MKTIVCESGVELLTEYLEDALTLEVRVSIETHVADCARCQAFMASYQSSLRLVRDATHVQVPAGLEASLIAAVRAVRSMQPNDDGGD